MDTITVKTTIASQPATYQMPGATAHKQGLRSLINGMPSDMAIDMLSKDIESNTFEYDKAVKAGKFKLANFMKTYIKIANELIIEVQNDK
jgi:hypothetical protein